MTDLLNPDEGKYHVMVKFGRGIPDEVQGELLLAMEQMLRERDVPAEVFLETMRDQNVLRRKLTTEDAL